MKRILFGVFAHPDDEAFGPLGTLIQEVKNGTELHLICATKGEAGNNPDNHPSLGDVRLREWQNSCELIGATSHHQLYYPDGGLSNKFYLEIADKVKARVLEIITPQHETVDLQFITFEPRGLTGHLDHVAMSLITTFVYEKLRAALLPKPVEKIGLRYFCLCKSDADAPNTKWIYMPVGVPDDQVDETNDVSDVYEQKMQVIAAHHTQREDAAMIQEKWGQAMKRECFCYAKD